MPPYMASCDGVCQCACGGDIPSRAKAIELFCLGNHSRESRRHTKGFLMGVQFLICSTGHMEWMWHRLRTWGGGMCPRCPPLPGSYAYESILLFLTTNSPLCNYNYRNRGITVLTKMFTNLMDVNGYFVKVYLEHKGIGREQNIIHKLLTFSLVGC